MNKEGEERGGWCWGPVEQAEAMEWYHKNHEAPTPPDIFTPNFLLALPDKSIENGCRVIPETAMKRHMNMMVTCNLLSMGRQGKFE